MSTKKPVLSQVSCTYGAPMGRRNDRIPDPSSPVKIYIGLLPMSSDGAYDKGGAYWGIGQTLYRACWWELDEDGGGSGEAFVRASSRTDACQQLGIKFSQLARGFREVEYELQGNYGYGHGWECLTTESRRHDIQQRKQEYMENDPRTPYRIVKKYVRIEDVED